jgi:hypothetical protein
MRCAECSEATNNAQRRIVALIEQCVECFQDKHFIFRFNCSIHCYVNLLLKLSRIQPPKLSAKEIGAATPTPGQFRIVALQMRNQSEICSTSVYETDGLPEATTLDGALQREVARSLS